MVNLEQFIVCSESYFFHLIKLTFNGTQVCPDGLHGFRYLKIYLDAVDSDGGITQAHGTVKITLLSLDYTTFLGTPETYKGCFESLDKQLKQVINFTKQRL
jgi:hypothetical protein